MELNSEKKENIVKNATWYIQLFNSFIILHMLQYIRKSMLEIFILFGKYELNNQQNGRNNHKYNAISNCLLNM